MPSPGDESSPAGPPRKARVIRRAPWLPPELCPPLQDATTLHFDAARLSRAAVAPALDDALQGPQNTGRHYADLMGAEVRQHPR